MQATHRYKIIYFVIEELQVTETPQPCSDEGNGLVLDQLPDNTIVKNLWYTAEISDFPPNCQTAKLSEV